jgi:hypothetical protein
MTIFLVLNGLGIVFLLYVLANFWQEGHRHESDAEMNAAEIARRHWAGGDTGVCDAIPRSALDGVPVIPFQARGRRIVDSRARSAGSRATPQARAGLISTR